jgi:hypothetical protein
MQKNLAQQMDRIARAFVSMTPVCQVPLKINVWIVSTYPCQTRKLSSCLRAAEPVANLTMTEFRGWITGRLHCCRTGCSTDIGPKIKTSSKKRSLVIEKQQIAPDITRMKNSRLVDVLSSTRREALEGSSASLGLISHIIGILVRS